MAYASTEDSDQSGYPPNVIRVLAVRLKGAKGLSYNHADSRDSDLLGEHATLFDLAPTANDL